MIEFDKGRDSPLRCNIEGEELVIRIGVGTLAFCAEHCPRFYEEEKHAINGPPYCQVTAPNELANDVKGQLFREAEDGSSPLSDLLDECIEAAREDGSLAFLDLEEPEIT